jgi:ATP-dependent DNA helicase RecG
MESKELKLIQEEGEGFLIEFKEKPSNLDKEIVAFANGSGGRIFIGISDSGDIKGIRITNKLKSQIQDIANNCEPPVKIRLEEIDSLLVIHVSSGQDKPYSCKSGFYTRIGPNAQKMKRNQIIEFFQSEGQIRFEELINLKFNYEKDFDPEKLNHFLTLAGIAKVLDTPSVLVNLGVAEHQEGSLMFNNTGIFFFARDLDRFYPHAGITCALYKGIEKVDVLDRKDFNKDIISNVDNAMLFLRQHIPVRYEFDGSPQRIEVPQVPLEAMREAVINAVCHRYYFEKGATVMVEIFDDRIEISSPGGLVKGLLKKDFGKKSVLRNPKFAGLFHRIGYIEKMGTGIKRMQNLMRKAGHSPIIFEFTTFVTAVFDRGTPKDIQVSLQANEGLSEGLNEGLKTLLAVISQNPGLNTRQTSQKLDNRPIKTLERQMKTLNQKGLIEHRGSKKTGGYYLKG